MAQGGNLFIIDYPNSDVADPKNNEYGQTIVDNAQLAIDMQAKLDGLSEQPPTELTITYFRNWGETRSTLLFLAKPTTVAEVQGLVNLARDELDVMVGCGGGYHSWAPIFPDEGNLLINATDIQLDEDDNEDPSSPFYRRIRFANGSTSVVNMAPGVTGVELMKFFFQENVCIRSDVVLPTVTYGGVISGGCHGTGKDEGTVSDKVSHLKVVNSDGAVQTFDTEADLLAARVNLATFGVMVEIGMEVVPMEYAEVGALNPTVGEAFTVSYLRQIYDANWSLELFWYPYNSLPFPSLLPSKIKSSVSTWVPEDDHLLIRKINVQTRSEIEKKGTKVEIPNNPFEGGKVVTEKGQTVQLEDYLLQELSNPIEDALRSILNLLSTLGLFAVNAINPILTAYPELVPVVLKLVYQGQYLQYKSRIIGGTTVTTKLPYAIHFQDGIPLNPLYNMEFAFPFNPSSEDGFVTLANALNVLKTLLKNVTGYPVSMVVEARLMGRSNSYLSPAHAVTKNDTNDCACYVEVLSQQNTPDYLQFYTALAAAWLQLGGVPHWNKQWDFYPGINGILRDIYGQDINNFTEIRDAANVDTNDLFLNQTMKDILYPTAPSKK